MSLLLEKCGRTRTDLNFPSNPQVVYVPRLVSTDEYWSVRLEPVSVRTPRDTYRRMTYQFADASQRRVRDWYAWGTLGYDRGLDVVIYVEDGGNTRTPCPFAPPRN